MIVSTPMIDNIIDSTNDIATLVITHNVMFVNVIDNLVEVLLSHPSGTRIVRRIPCATHAQAYAVSTMLNSVWCKL